MYLYKISDHIKLIFETPLESSYWFGYYNLSPINKNSDKLLAHKINFDQREIVESDEVEIGWFDLKTAIWNKVGYSKSFNWQQGSMLQWLGPNYNDKIIYNDYENQKYISKIFSIIEKTATIIDFPIYSVLPNGLSSISLEFERSYWCRAYHYVNIKNKNLDVRIFDQDGIFRVDLISNSRNRILDIKSIISHKYNPYFDNCKHWIEHIHLNKEGTKFSFLHRFGDNENFYTRVFICNIEGQILHSLSNWQSEGYSHFSWRDNNEFIVFGSKRMASGKVFDNITNKTKYGEVIRMFYHLFISNLIPKKVRESAITSKKYYFYSEVNGELSCKFINHLNDDGHPSFTSDGQYMLTDTYADKDNFRHLLLINIKNNIIIKLGSFYSPFNNCDFRCDLHPRFSIDNKYIIIDTAHNRKRQILVFEINWESIIK